MIPLYIDNHTIHPKYLVLLVDNVDKYVDILLIECGCMLTEAYKKLNIAIMASMAPPALALNPFPS